MTRYYSTQRPVDLGTYPKPNDNKILNIENFGCRIYEPEIGQTAWGYIEYEKELSDDDIKSYELVKEWQPLHSWSELNDGDVIIHMNGDTMTFGHYDYYNDGDEIPCVMTDNCIYPCTEFDLRDWQVLKTG